MNKGPGIFDRPPADLVRIARRYTELGEHKVARDYWFAAADAFKVRGETFDRGYCEAMAEVAHGLIRPAGRVNPAVFVD